MNQSEKKGHTSKLAEPVLPQQDNIAIAEVVTATPVSSYQTYQQQQPGQPQYGYGYGQQQQQQQQQQPIQQVQGYSYGPGQPQYQQYGTGQGQQHMYGAGMVSPMTPMPQQMVGHGPHSGHGNVPVQSVQGMQGIGGVGFIEGRRRLLIKQRFEFLESAANAVGFGCIEQANKYDIFDYETGENILFVKEESEMCMRCCCKPNHAAKLVVYDSRGMQYIPPQTHGGMFGGMQHQQHPSSQMYGQDRIVMTVNKPCKLNCCVCLPICAHEQTAYLKNGQKVGSAQKTIPCGGCFTPNLEVKDSQDKVYAMVEGPFCITGGLIELCTSLVFKIKDQKSGQVVGHIEKMKPKGMGAMQEAVGDADQFVIELPQLGDNMKSANLVATLLLLDYVFFEGGPPITYNPADGSCSLNCWNCYCCGMNCGCNCKNGGKHDD